VATTYDFSGVRHLVNVGGGNGALLTGILKAHPHLKGTLLDRPEVVERAGPSLRELGLADRCETGGGDFFAQVPGGADAYLLKHVIHHWNDDRATAILETCRRAMPSSARLLIAEGVYPQRIDQSDASRGAIANDVKHACVHRWSAAVGSGISRAVRGGAGFALSRIIATDLPYASIIEGVPR